MSRLGLRHLPASFHTCLDPILQPLAAYCYRNRIFLALLLAPPIVHRLYGDYTDFLSLGPGGIPYNPLGWLISSFARAVLPRDVLSTTVYTTSPSTRTYLPKLPIRQPPRPSLGSHPLPQRQTSQVPSRDVIDAVESAILEIHADYASSTELKTSVYEKMGMGLFIRPNVHSPTLGEGKREVAHVHATEEAGEGSLHVLLAPRDCVEVIEKGWGQRHRLAGVWGGRLLPAEYLLVYAPREWSEVAVVRRIVEAGVRAALGVEGKAVPGGWK
ncbi:hypothetical protein K440DRAFT_664682 [Wilcoxina mikolae CBS 423.85]|nr:hypothetical protein K440DRAFT_664682 [Wilcoxina mikolae CBS 423.85]